MGSSQSQAVVLVCQTDLDQSPTEVATAAQMLTAAVVVVKTVRKPRAAVVEIDQRHWFAVRAFQMDLAQMMFVVARSYRKDSHSHPADLHPQMGKDCFLAH